MDKKKFLIIKYAASLMMPLMCILFREASWGYFVTAMACVLMIAILTNGLCRVKTWIAYIFNSLALLLVNVQYAILFWSNSFVTSVMMNNLDSVEALGGKFLQYGITTILVVAFSLLPISRIGLKKKHLAGAVAVCMALYGVICWQGMYDKEPTFSMYEAISKQISRYLLAAEIKSTMNGENEFFKYGVTDYVAKPENLTDSPNVILIFTEGLSQHIVEDERNIMPNMKALSKKSLVFDNYFNHTFATYMGLSGQLYSGYQENNYDQNCLISLQNVFNEYGYQTTFINTEPKNPEFTDYLKGFGFDNLISDTENLDGINGTMSDKAAYEFLMKTAMEQNMDKKPFFVSMYTFGTHVSFDGVHAKFGDRQDPLLNRFYDLDVQLGKFIEAFENSPLFENTVFIITSDHATYCDSDFAHAFPDYQQTAMSLDRIPFYIYYRGVDPKVCDVNGRNSLNMTPTVLDYLDMTGYNYFLGESLFSPYENTNPFDTIYESFGDMYDTSGGSIQNMGIELRKNMESQIAKYFAVKMLDSSIEAEYLKEPRAVVEVEPLKFEVKVIVTNANEWDSFEYAVWSDENGQDDLQWYRVPNSKEDNVENVFSLSYHTSPGFYHLHVYGRKGEDSEFIASTTFFVSQEALKNRSVLHIQYDKTGKELDTVITNPADWDSLRYAVWSDKDGQDDVKWFISEDFGKSEAKLKIDMSGYDTAGTYHIHVYANKDGNLFRIAVATFDV